MRRGLRTRMAHPTVRIIGCANTSMREAKGVRIRMTYPLRRRKLEIPIGGGSRTGPEMLVLLNVLAHNVLVWARSWLAEETLRLKRYGTLRFVRDLLSSSGVVEVDQRNRVRRIILNRAASLARGLLSALRRLLLREDVTIILDKI